MARRTPIARLVIAPLALAVFGAVGNACGSDSEAPADEADATTPEAPSTSSSSGSSSSSGAPERDAAPDSSEPEPGDARDAAAVTDAETSADDAGDATPDAAQAPDPCAPNPCEHFGTCFAVGQEATCSCFGDWTGPRCATCGPRQCSTSPNFYRDRFLSCFNDKDFCTRPYASCQEFCAGWMGCVGDLAIDEAGIGQVTGPDRECF